MKRIVIALAFVVGCLQSHDTQVAVRQDDCSTCHITDYNNTAVPSHSTAGYPKTCGDCHRTSSWQPALGGIHPDDMFPRASGPHGGIKCLVCHDLDSPAPSVDGANTNCIQCHPNNTYQMDSHTGAKNPTTGVAYAYQSDVVNFCLQCHPKGLANKHPDTKFPRTGPHKTACQNCHDRSSGLPDTEGMNTTCLRSGCHTLSKEDSNHADPERRTMYQQARGDGSNKHFCLLCHPSGRT